MDLIKNIIIKSLRDPEVVEETVHFLRKVGRQYGKEILEVMVKNKNIFDEPENQQNKP